MAQWVFYCDECNVPFTYSEIQNDGPGLFAVEAKPEIAAEGINLDCPNCKKPSIFRRHQLVYQTS
jgi:hypothetical protein